MDKELDQFGRDLLESVRQMKRGEAVRVTRVEVPMAAQIRHRLGLSQKEFAELLDVSPGTLRGWEQGRREPTGTARTLLRVAEKHPEALRDLAG
ncbi:helix-turn-helix domain-containing protein [Halomonas sp. 25-S5]|uniref:helix-turn-helix domain-containing protein n=1 Tax=Halomonas sp. 25-S5 TaxID=2994065 RepID=UPI0024694AB7|nr:helix-turn-helix domain-containing protein [Halomonas sp. 25-S5]